MIDGGGAVEYQKPIHPIARRRGSQFRQRIALQRRDRQKTHTPASEKLESLGPRKNGVPVASGPFELPMQKSRRFQIQTERRCVRSGGRFSQRRTGKTRFFLLENGL